MKPDKQIESKRGRRAIVIGATSGIGKELARALSKKGYKVGITGRRLNELQKLADENPDTFVIKPFDVTKTDMVVQNLEELVVKLGGLDLLIYNSGVVFINKELDFGFEETTIDVNVCGFTIISDWAFNYFQNQRFGHLVGITSMGGLRGWRDTPAYNGSKAYQINYLEGLRNKAYYLKYPVYITDVRPGYVDTAMAIGSYKFWVASAEKIARQICFAIEKKRKVVYVTKRWMIIGFLMKRIPAWLHERG
ncbi:MAG: SDR family NAD(P)-dependent oxidoreductase [Prolixibacteraceae bacterium]|nr:SDR family NAD(P)-dependent oxidoreductase [Prolixibacteraceae bacterium]